MGDMDTLSYQTNDGDWAYIKRDLLWDALATVPEGTRVVMYLTSCFGIGGGEKYFPFFSNVEHKELSKTSKWKETVSKTTGLTKYLNTESKTELPHGRVWEYPEHEVGAWTRCGTNDMHTKKIRCSLLVITCSGTETPALWDPKSTEALCGASRDSVAHFMESHRTRACRERGIYDPDPHPSKKHIKTFFPHVYYVHKSHKSHKEEYYYLPDLKKISIWTWLQQKEMEERERFLLPELRELTAKQTELEMLVGDSPVNPVGVRLHRMISSDARLLHTQIDQAKAELIRVEEWKKFNNDTFLLKKRKKKGISLREEELNARITELKRRNKPLQLSDAGERVEVMHKGKWLPATFTPDHRGPRIKLDGRTTCCVVVFDEHQTGIRRSAVGYERVNKKKKKKKRRSTKLTE